MVRFSCFAPAIHYHRPKKVVQHFDGPVHTNNHVASQDQVVKASSGSAMLNLLTEENNPSSADQITSPSSCWKSEDLNDNLSLEDGKDFLRMLHLKKSQSFGNILEEGRGFSFEDDSEDNEMDQRFSFGNSCDKNMQGITDSLKNSGSAVQDGHGNFHGDLGMNLHHEENVIDSFDFCAELVHHESLFSIGILKQFDGDQADDAGNKSADHFAESGCRSSETLPVLVRSRSLANLRINTDNFLNGAPTREFMGPRSRSFEDSNSLSGGRAEFLNRDAALFSGKAFHMPRAASYSHDMPKALDLDEKRAAELADAGDECLQFHKSGGCNEGTDQDGDVLLWREKGKCESHSVDGDDSHCYGGLMNEWRQPKTNNLEIRNDLQHETSVQNRDDLISKEFNIKRIEEWISQIDIQNGCSIEEPGESSNSVPKMDPHIVADVSAAKVDAKNSPGMEAAYNYISSLTVASSSAQMANLGLVVVPFLGAFISLKVLNLSGNSIVRITAGALPRGLHVLNLSKNNISTIEGLRELTRLRVLDLSYNRISRIGHGLASCSSLKELYLAGNKISEVEGLHRLLKLNILDLRFNKISTSKGLGQLAANYTSLQAINLEGNPAQRNVGDEHLKKYLISLLPNLVYFNKQTTRAVSMKEVPDRSTRSIIAHQFDRGMRSENKPPRRGAHGSSSLHKSAASSSHHRLSHAQNTTMKHAKSRHGQQPLAGSRITHHLPNISSKPLSLHPSSTIRRIRSEGTL